MRQDNFFKNTLFKPSVIREYTGRKQVTLSDHAQNSFEIVNTTGSFKFDPAGSPLKSTQQLNVDFSKFENHTFFNSARNKVHIAFEKIINQYPFDGTRAEYENFFEKLSGFEKYVFDLFPKNTGFLIFDRAGSNPGTHLSIVDFKGSGNNTGNNKLKGEPVLTFNETPFTIECNLFVPSGSSNQNEIIAQRVNAKSQGFTLAISSSENQTSPSGMFDLLFITSDETKSQTVTKTRLPKGQFLHVSAIYDRGQTDNLKILIDGDNEVTSSGKISLSNIDLGTSTFTIGTGSIHTYNGLEFSPTATLSGSLDDFRFFNSSRDKKDTRAYMNREIFSQKDLKLYFKFNEPSGSFSLDSRENENLCLDHSGNELHTKIENFTMSQRDTSRLNVKALKAEDPSTSPVLFPSFKSVRDLSQTLIATASNYDVNNPNLITKLIPDHYLEEEKFLSGYQDILENLEEQPGMSIDEPGGNKIQQAQLITSVLFMWSEIFDDIKLFIDELSRLTKVDYINDDTISSQLLPFLAKYHSFKLPSQFNNASIEQFMQGKNITLNDAHSNKSLQEVQNTIWRRILTDLPEIRKTKGTRASAESVLRNIGINPGTTFRIKEYGGNPRREITNSYQKRTRIGRTLTFSGSLAAPGTTDGEGRPSTRPLLTSGYLSGSRTEPGLPKIQGTFVDGASNNTSDGLLTSGSWTVESVIKMDGNLVHKPKQSIMRLQTTGSYAGSPMNWILYNLVSEKPNIATNETGSLTLYGKVDPLGDKTLKLEIKDIDIFDGSKWHISFGRDANITENYVSSSYFLRAGKSKYISEPEIYSASAIFYDKGQNALNNVASAYNQLGAFITFGSMSLPYSSVYDSVAPGAFLNSVGYTTYPDAKVLDFSGKVSNVRFFTKALTKQETLEHIGNPFSLGVKNPDLNFNFVTNKTGSYEKLRLNYSMGQLVTQSNTSGGIEIFDFTQNNFTGKGTGFEIGKDIIEPLRHDYRSISPKLDTKSSDNKVRIRSFKSLDLAIQANTGIAPVYEVPPSEKPYDDRRVEIEVSSVQALNDDIILLFSSLDYFDNAIGDPELVFSNDYKNLQDMRRIYFNRLTEKMSLTRFFSFFKWFDNTVGDILEDIVPRTSRYLGTNFIIESHTLERAKFPYMYLDMYLGELERPNPGQIYVQQLIGKVKRR